jgi:hypothetical protein
MAQTKFYIDVNPFTQIANIRAKIGKDTYESEVEYTLPDSWYTFSMGEDIFDVHFIYENEFTAEVYSGEEFGTLQDAFPTKITLRFKD